MKVFGSLLNNKNNWEELSESSQVDTNGDHVIEHRTIVRIGGRWGSHGAAIRTSEGLIDNNDLIL